MMKTWWRAGELSSLSGVFLQTFNALRSCRHLGKVFSLCYVFVKLYFHCNVERSVLFVPNRNKESIHEQKTTKYCNNLGGSTGFSFI